MATASLVFAILAALSTGLMLLSMHGVGNTDGLGGFFEMIAAVLFGLVAIVLLVIGYVSAHRGGAPLPSRAVLAGALLLLSAVLGTLFSR